MIRLLKIATVLVLSFFLCGFKLPGMMDNKTTLKEYFEKTEESDIENARDYSGKRPASLNKKPWLANNIHDMESLSWPDQGNGRDYAAEDGTEGTVNFRFYSSTCALRGPIVLGPITTASDNGCNEPYNIDVLWLKGIITGVDIDGPAKLMSPAEGANFTVLPYVNATYNSIITVRVTTVSDEQAQDNEDAAYIASETGLPVTAADLRRDRSDYNTVYYSNRGCELKTRLKCTEDCECIGGIPTIYASSSTITPGGSITLYVDSGGAACPPYFWKVSGKGYDIGDDTENDLETVTLTSAAGT